MLETDKELQTLFMIYAKNIANYLSSIMLHVGCN